MKATGSPTKRNSENAISPTVSMTRTAWAMRRRMNASMFERMVPHVLRRKARRLAAAPRAPRPAVAGHARPVPHLAFGGHAAADAGRRGDPVLREVPAALSQRIGARAGFGRRSAAALERAWLLRAGAQPAPGGSGDPAQRISTHGGEDCQAARCRSL